MLFGISKSGRGCRAFPVAVHPIRKPRLCDQQCVNNMGAVLSYDVLCGVSLPRVTKTKMTYTRQLYRRQMQPPQQPSSLSKKQTRQTRQQRRRYVCTHNTRNRAHTQAISCFAGLAHQREGFLILIHHFGPHFANTTGPWVTKTSQHSTFGV
jgi:hypothetical protein